MQHVRLLRHLVKAGLTEKTLIEGTRQYFLEEVETRTHVLVSQVLDGDNVRGMALHEAILPDYPKKR